MILTEITLENFGTYGGTNTLDVRPEASRPVVLVGGTNGAGKTTLLEALLLCLHGRRALGPSVRAKDYEAHISSRLHVPAAGEDAPAECAVSVRFDHTESGSVHEYLVDRRWHRTPAGAIREDLLLVKDESLVDDLPEAAWQDFLDGLVPPGVANLFFFDGERIQALAEDESGDRLKEAVRRLLGLDLVAQLRSDLSRYVGRQEAGESATARSRVAAALEGCAEAQGALAKRRTERATLIVRHEAVAARAERERERFARQGGMLAAERGKLEAGFHKAVESAAASEARVRELVAGLLPFAICPDIARAVRVRLAAEHVHEEREILLRRIADVQHDLSAQLTSMDGSSVPALVAQLIAGESDPLEDPPIHDLTSTDRALLTDQLTRVLGQIPSDAAKVARVLRKAEEARTRTRELLDRAPESSDVSELLVHLQTLEREVGRIDAELERVADEIQRAEYEHKVAERELRRAREALGDEEGLDARVGYAVRAAAVLDEFESRALESKLDRIGVEAARFFNRLSRKGSLLSRVEIDSDSFRVELRRWDDAQLPKERLSAGEKQLLAIALLWALAHVSGRPLPVVIDTPLARLDRSHREKLLREYLPAVSHQVIVLSTDTEVDAAAAAVLEPSVSRTYHLVHDADTCRTSIRDGYFAANEEAVGAG